MKIEMTDSISYSWLRHVKACQVVQSNWRIAPDFKIRGESQLAKMLEKIQGYFFDNFQYKIFRQNLTMQQIMEQGENDAIGLRMNEYGVQYYVVDLTCQDSGLNYGTKEETISRILAKLTRMAFCIYGSFGARKGNLFFCSPKISQSVMTSLQLAVDDLMRLFREEGVDYLIRVIANDEYVKEVLEPVSCISEDLDDAVELFVKSCRLMQPVIRKQVEEAKQAVRNELVEEQVSLQNKLKEEILASEKKLEETNKAAEKRLEEEKLATEKRLEEIREAAEKKLEEVNKATEKRQEEAKEAAEKKLEEVSKAAERKAEEDKKTTEKRIEEIKLEAERKVEKAKIEAKKEIERMRSETENIGKTEKLDIEKKTETENQESLVLGEKTIHLTGQSSSGILKDNNKFMMPDLMDEKGKRAKEAAEIERAIKAADDAEREKKRKEAEEIESTFAFSVFSDKTRKAKEAEAERKAKEVEAAETLRKAKETEAAEAERKAKETEAAEAERKAKETEAAEAERKAKEAEAAETLRKAKETEAAEAERKAKETEAAEAERKAKEAELAEAERKAKESEKESTGGFLGMRTPEKITEGNVKKRFNFLEDTEPDGPLIGLNLGVGTLTAPSAVIVKKTDNELHEPDYEGTEGQKNQPSKLAYRESLNNGYQNRYQQVNMGFAGREGKITGQRAYFMRCRVCGYEYEADGCDIWQKKCPSCMKNPLASRN